MSPPAQQDQRVALSRLCTADEATTCAAAEVVGLGQSAALLIAAIAVECRAQSAAFFVAGDKARGGPFAALSAVGRLQA